MKTLTIALSVLAVVMASISAAALAAFWFTQQRNAAEREEMLRAQIAQLSERHSQETAELGERFGREFANYQKQLKELTAQNAELNNRIAELSTRQTDTLPVITTGMRILDLGGVQRRQAVAGLKGGRGWGPEQATGEPDTLTPGDLQTAWASRTQDDRDEWLQLEYDQPYMIAKVKVYETYNPGALSRITTVDDEGKETEIWRGRDPTAVDAPMGVSEVEITRPAVSKRIKIYLDSMRVKGWNEIDAVGIVYDRKALHWAVKASASSTFAEPEVVAQPPVAPPRPPQDGQF